MSCIRVLIADDATEYRRGIALLLKTRPEFEIIGEANDGIEAISLCSQYIPDVVLMDLRMPRMSGVEATQQLTNSLPQSRVLALTTFDEDELVFEVLHSGARGYLLKDVSPEQLFDAIRAVYAGHSWLQPSIASKVISVVSTSLRERNKINSDNNINLSSRELTVLCALCEGFSNKEIASKLFIAEGRVKNHLTRIFEKLDVSDRTQAVLVARDLGLIEPKTRKLNTQC